MTSTLGIVMLVHTALGRAEQVARHWAKSGCPLVIHVDRAVPDATFDGFKKRLGNQENIHFCQRYRCEWGTWGLVAATQAAAERLLRDFPTVRHVYLASGSCLPLRPVSNLVDYLDARPRTDFIESATTSDVPWTVGGLDHERFTLRFPFAWKRQKWLFDRYVTLQRRLGVERKIPKELVPHMGSQWWCLTRQTLTGILQDPNRPRFDRYFSRVWIPDESYFQTLARRYSTQLESRSLTLSKFDFQGKPYIFYDDHLQLLRRSDCFVARKIWPQANKLYDTFLNDTGSKPKRAEPNPSKIDRIFSKAVERRVRGRPGLYMQSRFPREDCEKQLTAAPYSVFQGFDALFEDFQPWLSKATGTHAHGRLFDPERVEFSGKQDVLSGGLSDSVGLRDYNPCAFLTNLIWNTRGERQCFQYSPACNQDIIWPMVKDTNAQISVITGAWAIPLFRSNTDFKDLCARAARLQHSENMQVSVFRSFYAKARVRVWTLAEFIEAPMESMQAILSEITPNAQRLSEAPRMVDLDGFGQFLQNLRNHGMHPHLMGDFPVESAINEVPQPRPKPYLIRK